MPGHVHYIYMNKCGFWPLCGDRMPSTQSQMREGNNQIRASSHGTMKKSKRDGEGCFGNETRSVEIVDFSSCENLEQWKSEELQEDFLTIKVLLNSRDDVWPHPLAKNMGLLSIQETNCAFFSNIFSHMKCLCGFLFWFCYKEKAWRMLLDSTLVGTHRKAINKNSQRWIENRSVLWYKRKQSTSERYSSATLSCCRFTIKAMISQSMKSLSQD